MQTDMINSTSLEQKYGLCRRTIVKILAGIPSKNSQHNREKLWPTDDAFAAIDAYIAEQNQLRTKPDLKVYCYSITIVTLFKVGKSTLRQWMTEPDFPKPAGYFCGMPRYKTPYFLIQDVAEFIEKQRSREIIRAPFTPTDANQLNSVEANAFLGLPDHYLIKYYRSIPGLPAPEKISRFFVWNKIKLADWMQSLGDNTPHDMFLDYASKERNNETTSKQLALSRQFISGQFAPPDQQRAFKTKRAHARRHPPKTTIVLVASEW